MKIRYLIMFKMLLALFGCSKAPKTTTVSNEAGPFTIETITRKGKTWNMNYGRVNYTDISYDVKYKGKPLQFKDGLETNTGLPGIWRVFYLKDAASPTLLLGSQSLYLVQLQNDQPVVRPLHVQSSDFASIQWLDSEGGQPGIYREIYSSDEYDTDNIITRGRYLALSGTTVLDTRTFELYPFNRNQEWIDGYSIARKNIVAFSPDSMQVVLCGQKNDEVDYMKTHYAWVCFNFRDKTAYSVPFDSEALHMKSEERIDSEWFSDHFEWKKSEEGPFRLQPISGEKLVLQKGKLFFERHQGYQYELDPVQEPMIEHVFQFILKELHLDTTLVTRTTEKYNNKYIIPYQQTQLLLEYGKYGSDLLLKEDPPKLPYQENRTLISRLAKGFNVLLGEGKYREEWETVDAGVTEE
jgi:hypothetical protein